MSAAPLIRLLVLGAVAGGSMLFGYAAGLADTEDEPTAKAMTLDEALQRRLLKLGRDLLDGRKDLAVAGKVDRRGYLKQTYRGLYCLGRAGHKLTGSGADSYARELRHLHQQLGRQSDGPIIDWYETVGAGSGTSLVEVLSKCPEVKRADLDPRYIAFAFGEASENLPFGKLSDEVIDRFAA